MWALLLAGIIAVSWAMLAPGAEAHGEKVLVSNVGRLDSTTTDAQNSQAFTTGSNPADYVLNSVQLTLVDVDGSDIKVRIFTTDSDGKPDSELYTLTNPDTLSSNSGNVFNAPADSSLDADTTYAVVVTDEDGTGSLPGIDMRRTTDTAEDTTQEGWSIADESFTRSTSTASWTEEATEKLQIRIRGVINNNPATGRPPYRRCWSEPEARRPSFRREGEHIGPGRHVHGSLVSRRFAYCAHISVGAGGCGRL